MSIYHNVIGSEDEMPNLPVHGYRDLEGFPIHQIWQPERFRFISVFEEVTLQELDMTQHDFPPVIYDRMVPGLRLATLILEKILPDLARIRFGDLETKTSTGNIEDRVLSSHQSVPESQVSLMRQELIEMCYRIGFLPNASHDGATTFKLELNPPNMISYVQSAIGSSWLNYLSNPDWDDDIQDLDDRNGRYVLLACLLIHELAHAIWCQRMLPLAQDELARNGKLSVKYPEPKFNSSDGYCEVGYAIELQIFGGLLWTTNGKDDDFGDVEWITNEKKKDFEDIPGFIKEQTTVFGISCLTASGRASRRHQVIPQSVGALFNPSLWTRDETGKFPPLTLHMLPNLLNPGEEVETILSDPPPDLKYVGH